MAPVIANEAPHVAIRNARMLPGRLYGLSDPVLLFALTPRAATWNCDPAQFAAVLRQEIRDLVGIHLRVEDHGDCSQDIAKQVVDHLLTALLAMQRAAGFPVSETGKIVRGPDLEGGIELALPIPPAGLAIMRSVIEIMTRLLGQFIGGARIAESLREAYKTLQSYTLQPRNMVHFLTTARSQNIPYALRAGNIFEFGQGARSRRLQFTFTDATPLIATKLARNKVACAKLLRQASIPVPLHFSVASEEAAVRAAQDLGYPVVVKPADLDGGKGVAPGLVSPEDLRRAYRAAAALSSNLLVEKHFEGRDYRLVIMHDDLVLAIERRPAGVVGTGTHTVRQLLDQMNTERAVSTVGQTARPPITFDAEAAALLASQGLHEHAVPAQGKYVRLRRAANFELGGTVQVVTEKVHPDNVRLARRAVATIGLDLAGVDLLTPDIARSWMEVGAVICEVNGQPQFGAIRSPNIYETVLSAQVQGSGRIPVAVIAGSGSDADAVQREITNGLRKHGLRVGLASRDQVRIDDEMIAPGPTGIFAASQALVWDRGIDALVVRVADASVLGTGLPVDRLDLLVIGRPPSGNCVAWDDALNALHAMCRGEALSLAEADAVPEVDGRRDADSYRQIGRVMPRETIVQTGVGILVGARENQ